MPQRKLFFFFATYDSPQRTIHGQIEAIYYTIMGLHKSAITLWRDRSYQFLRSSIVRRYNLSFLFILSRNIEEISHASVLMLLTRKGIIYINIRGIKMIIFYSRKNAATLVWSVGNITNINKMNSSNRSAMSIF